MLAILRSLSGIYKSGKKEKTGKSFDSSGLVDQTAKSSNFLEDLAKLDRFAQSVEDETNSELARNGQDND